MTAHPRSTQDIAAKRGYWAAGDELTFKAGAENTAATSAPRPWPETQRSGYVACSFDARRHPCGRLPPHPEPVCICADGSRHDHRASHRSIGSDHYRRLRQSRARRHQFRTDGDDVERGLLHDSPAARRRVCGDRDRHQFSDDDAREHRGDGGRHGPRGRAARHRRGEGCGDRDVRRTADPDRRRQGHHRNQQQVHPGSAAGSRRAAPIAARPEPHRARSEGRQQRRRRARQHRDRRWAGRWMGPERRRRVRDARCAVRTAAVDDAQFPFGRGHHRVRGRQQRLQSGVRPRRRRGSELRVAIGLEQVAGQSLRVLPPRRARHHQLLQQGARPSEAAARAARLRRRVRRPGDAARGCTTGAIGRSSSRRTRATGTRPPRRPRSPPSPRRR